MPLTVEIVTVERKLLEESGIDEVIAPGVEGQLAVLPKHAAFMTMLAPGELILKRGAEEMDFAVTGGFFEVLNDKVIVLADAAERAEDIDTERAEAARQRAQQALERRESLEDAAAMQAALSRSMVRIKVAESMRRRRGARTTPHA